MLPRPPPWSLTCWPRGQQHTRQQEICWGGIKLHKRTSSLCEASCCSIPASLMSGSVSYLREVVQPPPAESHLQDALLECCHSRHAALGPFRSSATPVTEPSDVCDHQIWICSVNIVQAWFKAGNQTHQRHVCVGLWRWTFQWKKGATLQTKQARRITLAESAGSTRPVESQQKSSFKSHHSPSWWLHRSQTDLLERRCSRGGGLPCCRLTPERGRVWVLVWPRIPLWWYPLTFFQSPDPFYGIVTWINDSAH